MAETVIITGRDLAVDLTGAGKEPCNESRPAPVDPKRRRPPEYVSPAPTNGVDLLATISALARHNPYWSVEANDWADAHPEVRPKGAAKRWRKHRIETT